MANLRAIRKRISSVISTQKITQAMKVVSALRHQFGGHAMQTDAPQGGDASGGTPDQSTAATQAGSGDDSAPAES